MGVQSQGNMKVPNTSKGPSSPITNNKRSDYERHISYSQKVSTKRN